MIYLLKMQHIFHDQNTYYIYYFPRDIDISALLVSHLEDLVCEVDLKETVGDSFIHSFRFVPTFRSLPSVATSSGFYSILKASSFSDFSSDFRNTVSFLLSLIEHYRDVHFFPSLITILNVIPSLLFFCIYIYYIIYIFLFSISKTL